jgi:hypothetical protein
MEGMPIADTSLLSAIIQEYFCLELTSRAGINWQLAWIRNVYQ